MTRVTIEIDVTEKGLGIHALPEYVSQPKDPDIGQVEVLVVNMVLESVKLVYATMAAKMGALGKTECVEIQGDSPLVDDFQKRLHKP